MNHPEKAKFRFENGYACSQSVLSTLGPELGLDEETAFKVASAFGGGMVRHGEVCGAVTGALMTLGLKFGSATEDEEEAVRAASQELMRRFEEEKGSLLCRELLGYRLIVPEELVQARESGVFQTRCPFFVQRATELTKEIIER
jgi:C_GCAxxG_C_C family probable redox protein